MSRKLHDSKSDFRNRNILAFCLFVMLGILTIACVTKTVILNGNTIENQIVSYNVTSAFRQDLIDYTSDTFIKNGLNTSNIDDIITQNRAEDIIKSFSAGQFKSKAGYTSASSKQEIDELMNKIKAEIETQVKANGFEKNEEAENAQLDSIKGFINSSLTLPKTKLIETAMNLGKIASSVFLAIAVFLTLVFGSMLYFTGKKEYRSLRALGASFCAASITDLIVSLIAVIIFKIKSIDIYPAFIKNAVNNYVNTAIGAVAICAVLLFLIALLLLAISWKLKRED